MFSEGGDELLGPAPPRFFVCRPGPPGARVSPIPCQTDRLWSPFAGAHEGAPAPGVRMKSPGRPSLVFVGLVSVSMPSALVKASGVSDEVLPALAVVVKERAEQVAASQIRNRLRHALCLSRTFEDGDITFQLGKACGKQESASTTCVALFDQTCRLLNEVGLSLQDPLLLRTFRDDLIRGAVRTAGRGLAPAAWRSTLSQFEDYVAEMVALLTRETVTLADIAVATRRFAQASGGEEIISGLLRDSTKALLASAGAKELRTKLAGKEIDAPGLIASVLGDDVKLGRAPCKGDLALVQTVLTRMFDPASGEYPKAVHVPCASAYPDANEVEYCKVAQLLRLWDVLERARCAVEDPGASQDLVNSAFWDLTYAFAESEIYIDAADVVKGPFPKFEEMVLDASARRAELAASATNKVDTSLVWAGRLMAAAVVAAPEKRTKEWLALVEQEASAYLPTRRLTDFLDGKALRAPQGTPLPPVVDALRQTVRSFILFTLVSSSANLEVSDAAAAELMRLIESLERLTELFIDGKTQPRAAVQVTARVLGTLADLSNGSAAGSAAAKALADGAALLEEVAGGNYVYIPMRLAKAVDKEWPELENALRFGRVLLSAHQAKSPEEVQAVFRSALSDEMSREGRFDMLTIDAGAILAGRYGRVWNGTAMKGDRAPLAGLFAPFGFMIAYKHGGVMLYPIDLGAYLLAEGGTETVELQDAVRLGGELFVRLVDSVPISFGAGMSYVPAMRAGDGKHVTASAWLGIDLPMYVLR